MFGNIDPKKIAGMMSKMGIQQENIEAKRVIIEQEDKKIVIENPSVIKIEMQGNKSFQISGNFRIEDSDSDRNSEEFRHIKEESKDTSEEDIKTIIEKTGKTKKEAEKALKETEGDLAEAILSLQNS